jgi:prepilin-type N-terminal cleavage/methylation domain-containing protein
MIAKKRSQDGYTLVELLVAVVVLSILVAGIYSLLSGLIFSAAFIKKQAIGLTLATNQMEYYKSLPYDSLAVIGGSIYSANPLPAIVNKSLNGMDYKIVTTISYIDDAFDGCAAYPTQQLKEIYCRNYPPPTGSPATDLNPKDYKIIGVTAYDNNNDQLARVNTNISARVAETSSATGALFVKVIDDNGNPVSSATVRVTNSTLSPAIDMSDSTDVNGTAIFYDLKPDSNNYDFIVSASATDYSSLSTIYPSGSLQPNYPNQKIFTQQPSFLTLTIMPKGPNSIVVEATDPSGNAIVNAKIYVKGGYKKYTATTDTSYYYDNYAPSDARPTTDGNGLVAVSNLDPGAYIFCGDNGYINCTADSTTYYLAAALSYGGVNPFNPVQVPTYRASSPPVITFPYNGNNYLQKVRLILTTSSNFPRITNLTPYESSQSGGGLNAFAFQINGNNLPCDANPSNCSTTVKLLQGSSVFNASCSGTTAGLQLNCITDISGAVLGNTQLQIIANGYTLTTPSGMLGGINVVL